MQYYTTPSFEKSLRELEAHRKERIKKAMRLAVAFFETGRLPAGLGLKPLRNQIWEIRAGLADRVIFQKHKDGVKFILVGSHDEIKKFLRKAA